MGTVDLELAAELRDRLQLRRAVETGTYMGGTARALASLFESVVTIELARALHQRAAAALSDLPQVDTVHGHSADVLREMDGAGVPTLYFLDGHWSSGATGGEGDECPVLAEIAAIGEGCPQDCLIIDDACLFTSAPPPPHDPAKWPSIVEVFDAIRSQRPDHLVTLLADQVIAVPRSAKPVIDAYGARVGGVSRKSLGDNLRDQAQVGVALMRRRLSGRLTAIRARLRDRGERI